MTSGRDIEHAQRTRLDALARTGLLDAPAHRGLQRLTDLACRVLDVPIALVSLVDDHRQFYAAQSGTDAPLQRARQTPLSHSLCQFVVHDQADLVIEDARTQERLAGNGAVTDMDVVAYAGVPLATPDGIVYGSLCAIDHEARAWSESDLEVLHALGEAVASEIEVRALLKEREHTLAAEVGFRTQLEAKRQRLLMLARIGELVDIIDDHRELAHLVAMELAPSLCDWCIVEITAFEGDEPIIAVGALDHEQRELAEELRRIARATPLWRSPTIAAYEQRRLIYMTNVQREELVSGGDPSKLPPRLNELLDEIGMATVAAMPLISRERVVGSIAYFRSEPVGFDELERENQVEVARRIAMSVEAGRLRAAIQQRARAAEVIETIGDGVVLAGEDGRVQLWNPAITAISGIAESAAIGAPLREVAPQLAELIDEREALAPLARMLQFERDGDVRWASVSAVSVDGSYVLAVRDITDEHQLEQTRHELIATVSHQLRTPVASVLAAAVTLQRDDIELPAATRSAILDTIVQQSQRLVDLCGDVLLAARLDSGAHEITTDHVQLEPLLAELVRAVELQAGPELRIVLDVNAPKPVALGDEHALRQLFGNLLDNAVKYSPNGGAVTVATSVERGHVRVSVEDEGIGIPPAEAERVFERFYRLDPHMRGGVTGSGLGLYVVRELTRLMGGHVSIEQPASGVGTRMVVTLPSA